MASISTCKSQTSALVEIPFAARVSSAKLETNAVHDYLAVYFTNEYQKQERAENRPRATPDLTSQNQNQNRFIRSYYRPRRPLLRPYLVAVAEATWKKVYMNVCM